MKRSFLFGWAVLILATATLSAEDWSQFRGPNSNGLSAAKTSPKEWTNESANVAWSTPIAGLGWSSPAVLGDKIWLTTATEEGASLRAICLDLATGKELVNVEVIHLDKPGRVHSKNSHASPTPIVRDGFVIVHFGAAGMAKLKPTGEVVWKTPFDYRMVHGSGGSPVLHDGRLFVSCDGGDKQFVAAVDAETGKVVWSTERPANPAKKRFAFTTPNLLKVSGEYQIVSPGAGGVSAYSPADGKQLWQFDYPGGYSVIPQPTIGSNLVYVSSAFDRPELFAFDPKGEGNLTESNVEWTLSKGAPHTPTPILIGDELYIASDRGVATCVDARTGKVHWQERLGGNFSASPIYSADKIYFVNETGETTVVAPRTTYRELAKNQVKGRTLATPAPIEGALLLRTDSHLMRINAE
ncbi:MAG: PQQ-binding-like beta-propeller repeat protein [bacterium]|nr:PQQ-binding-like beta-propeller repeat protein [bacterium]